MRIVQLIDSLDAGGAERMAVNYANSLSDKIPFSALICTRGEGVLKNKLKATVPYLFLKKKRTLDIKALFRLRQFVKNNNVGIIHAHGPSFFTAVLLKFLLPSIKIVWHEHYGNRSTQKKHTNKVLYFCSYFFDGIFVVNKELVLWAKKNLVTKNIFYVSNFTLFDHDERQQTILKGVEGKRIVCLSNLRHPKNHITIVQAFTNSGLIKKGWTMHFVGKDYKDEYSTVLKEYILEKRAYESIFIYDSCSDIFLILEQATIGVLGSFNEGFPVVLLEYGLSGIATISTNVGYCKEIIRHNINGLVFDPNDASALENCFITLCEDEDMRNLYGQQLKKEIQENYSVTVVLNTIIKHYESL